MAQPTRSLRISVLQVESHCPAADENSKDFLSRQLERIKKLAGIAHAAGAEMAVFPELFLCGYESGRDKLHQLAQLPRESPCLNGVAQIACDLSMYLVVPYAERDDEGSLYNAAICYSPSGAEVFNYRKTHLFGDYEMNIFKAGDQDQLKVTTLEEHPSRLKIGCLICMDIEYCEPARVLALQGMELLIVPTALGRGPVEKLTPCCVIPTRAQENHVFIAYSNFCHVGPEEEAASVAGEKIVFCGRSAIVAPNGQDLQRSAGKHENVSVSDEDIVSFHELLIADLRPAEYAADVQRNPYLTARRPELYGDISRKR